MTVRGRHCWRLAVLALVAGCTTMKELPTAGQGYAGRLKTGDHIVVYETTGRVLDLRFVRLDGDRLFGSLAKDGREAVEVRVADIEKIEVERVAAGRTAGLVLGAIVLLPIAAVGAGAELSAEMQ